MPTIDEQIAEAQRRVKRLKARKVEIERKQHLEDLEAFAAWAKEYQLSTGDDKHITVFDLYMRAKGDK